MDNKVIFIMGVSGAGKTVVGQLLAQKLGVPFFDADDFHPPENIKKMKTGIPLSDADRKPWLVTLNSAISTAIVSRTVIVACSALRQSYRDILENNLGGQATWVFLKGNQELISSRLAQRKGHFMPPSLLASQFETMEEPGNALVLEVSATPDQLVDRILIHLER